MKRKVLGVIVILLLVPIAVVLSGGQGEPTAEKPAEQRNYRQRKIYLPDCRDCPDR